MSPPLFGGAVFGIGSGELREVGAGDQLFEQRVGLLFGFGLGALDLGAGAGGAVVADQDVARVGLFDRAAAQHGKAVVGFDRRRGDGADGEREQGIAERGVELGPGGLLEGAEHAAARCARRRVGLCDGERGEVAAGFDLREQFVGALLGGGFVARDARLGVGGAGVGDAGSSGRRLRRRRRAACGVDGSDVGLGRRIRTRTRTRIRTRTRSRTSESPAHRARASLHAPSTTANANSTRDPVLASTRAHHRPTPGSDCCSACGRALGVRVARAHPASVAFARTRPPIRARRGARSRRRCSPT